MFSFKERVVTVSLCLVCFFAGIVHMFPEDFVIQFGYDVHITSKPGPNYSADSVVLYNVQKIIDC